MEQRTCAASVVAVVNTQQAVAARIVRQSFLEQAQAAEHRHQQIVEVMRHAARQLPDGVHLLRFEQLRERRFPLPRPFLDPRPTLQQWLTGPAS